MLSRNVKESRSCKKYFFEGRREDCTQYALKPSLGVRLAEGFSPFGEKALALQVLVAFRALEALAVVVVVEGLDPAIPGLDGEAAAHALGGEQVVPVGLAVREAVLQVEGTGAEDLPAVGAGEALGVELLAYGVQAVPLDALAALGARGRQEALVAVLAVELALLLHEADVDERLAAGGRGAVEAVGAPVLAQRRHERASDLVLAACADGDPGGHSLVHDAPPALGGRALPGHALRGRRPHPGGLRHPPHPPHCRGRGGLGHPS